MAPTAGSACSRLTITTPVPVSYFASVSNNNNVNSSSAAQFVRVVTNNAPIQPKLVPGWYCAVLMLYCI